MQLRGVVGIPRIWFCLEDWSKYLTKGYGCPNYLGSGISISFSILELRRHIGGLSNSATADFSI